VQQLPCVVAYTIIQHITVLTVFLETNVDIQVLSLLESKAFLLNLISY